MKRADLALSVTSSLAAAAFLVRMTASPREGALTAAVTALGAGAVVARALSLVRARIALLLVLLAATAVLTGARVLGHDLLGADPWESRGYAAFLTVACAAAAGGLLRRAPWSRWIVLALGGAGVATGGLNLLRADWGAVLSPGRVDQAWWLWPIGLLTSGALPMVVLASGAPMQDAFGQPYSPERPSSLWRSEDPLVAWVRRALIAGFAGAAMALLYGLGQPPRTAATAGAIAVALAFLGSALLTLARKTAGVLLLSLTGIGFLAQAATVMALARDARQAGYYAVFWAVAGLAALVCGGQLLARRGAARIDPQPDAAQR